MEAHLLLEPSLALLSTPFRHALEKPLNGQPLTGEDAYLLIHASGAELPALMLAASHLRAQGKGNTVTYSRKVFLPLTNLCRDRCGYCTFVHAPKETEAHTMTPDEVLQVATEGARLGCKEALFSLGDRPELRHVEARRHLKALGYASTPEYLTAMCHMVLEQTGLLPHTNAGLLTRDELLGLREVNASMGLMLENVSDRLLERGGPHFGAKSKVPRLRLAMMETAGDLGIAFTTGILIGIGETLEERVDSLFAIGDLHRRCGHIQEVIIQNFRAKADTRMRDASEPSVLDMVRTIAVARLVLGPKMNIQAPPNLTPDAYQMYLLAGINDWGGVSPLTKDFINPEAPWPNLLELKQATEEVGFRLTERLAIYPEYVRNGSAYLGDSVRERIAALVSRDGFVKKELVQW
ncbi:MAG: 7,8-didemethyl-8-hydroxy-5-deazariboflavin synthase subunit CofG [Dehalococcoidia bacterium]|nr:7,8-didemethyl-8-hydroxy-5-deazariboflavin synthase subunit CofG [Dehalococcoidia bacterium]